MPLCICADPENMRRWPNVGLLLAHRLRGWPNNKPTLAERLTFAGNGPMTGQQWSEFSYQTSIGQTQQARDVDPMLG